MTLNTIEENIHDSKTNKLIDLSLSWNTHPQELYKKVFIVLPLLSDINDVHYVINWSIKGCLKLSISFCVNSARKNVLNNNIM